MHGYQIIEEIRRIASGLQAQGLDRACEEKERRDGSHLSWEASSSWAYEEDEGMIKHIIFSWMRMWCTSANATKYDSATFTLSLKVKIF